MNMKTNKNWHIIKSYFKDHFLFLILVAFSIFFVALNVKINIFSYNNFDFGKFDLGNMTQMMWNSLHGRPMWLTDYFGTNMPRWGMSHVDPLLLIFLPIFYFFQHSLTLVFIQVILVTATSFLLFGLAKRKLQNKLSAFFIALAFLFYPATGFLTSRTGFHGVTPAMFFFVFAFYLFEIAYDEQKFTAKRKIWFWILLVIAMMGKEQISLYVFLYGLFIWLFRGQKKLGWQVSVVSMVWFITAFFIIIPAFSNYRIEGYKKFADSVDVDPGYENEVTKSNYFLGRYKDFGDSYLEIVWGAVTHPSLMVRVLLGGDKPQNLKQTFAPLLFLPLLYPATFIMAVPDLIINYLTVGLGTSEIYNHRISMIVPVLFISTIMAISLISSLLSQKKPAFKYSLVSAILSGFVFIANVSASFAYENPVYLWATQSIKRHLLDVVFAESFSSLGDLKTLEKGQLVKDIPALDNKDIECAEKVVNFIPQNVSVSGPDNLGAHLAMRETYAIFPALYNEADFVIVDVFSQKLSNILGVNTDMVANSIEKLLRSDEYKLTFGCGNLFVYKKVGKYNKDKLLPIQERYEYPHTFEYKILDSLYIYDYSFPSKISKNQPMQVRIAYNKRKGTSLDGYVLYLTFIHEKTRELYQVASLAPLSISKPNSWDTGLTYVENQEVIMPDFLPSGNYKVLASISNKTRTRNVYLGDLEIL